MLAYFVPMELGSKRCRGLEISREIGNKINRREQRSKQGNSIHESDFLHAGHVAELTTGSGRGSTWPCRLQCRHQSSSRAS